MDDIINSLVGIKSQFKGNVILSGDFRIDGDFIGKIKSPGKVYISDTGRVKADIEAEYIVIAGVFEGNIVSSNCLIKASSVVIGFVNSTYLSCEPGAFLYTNLSVLGNKTVDNSPKNIENTKKSILKNDNSDSL